jgi:ribosomal protein L2
VRTPSAFKPPKPVRVGVVVKNFQITDGLIRDNKGTCSVYVVVDKDGTSIATAIPVQFKNKQYSVDNIKVSVDGVENEKLRNYFVKAIPATLKDGKWIAKGLKVGDKVILKSDIKVKNGDAVKLLAINN